MIKKIKDFNPKALIKSEKFLKSVENYEFQLLRGITSLSILSIINKYPEQGIYGYHILKEFQSITDRILVIKEATLYPMLKKMENDGILHSEKKDINGRSRIYYFLTEDGKHFFTYLMGFFTKIIQTISVLMDIKVVLADDRFFYCANCSNKIKIMENKADYCKVCGFPIKQ